MLGFNTGPTLSSNPAVKDWIPVAKIGGGTYVSIYNTGYGGSGTTNQYVNYFSVSAITRIAHSVEANPGITVQQAYMIDNKMDDGLPHSGHTVVCYVDRDIHSAPIWASGGEVEGAPDEDDHCGSTTTAATAYSANNCYDNNGVVGVLKYSTRLNGAIRNCALSFRFQ